MSYSKNYTCKFMQANAWHQLFHFHLSFWIWKKGKGRGKNTKIWICREWKELFRWTFFTVLEGLSFGEKIKIWWKMADTAFNQLTHFVPMFPFISMLPRRINGKALLESIERNGNTGMKLVNNASLRLSWHWEVSQCLIK